jgi:Fe-S oxidoreductase
MTMTNPQDHVLKKIKGIKDGPRAMRLYMELCAKCGTCSLQCHISTVSGEKHLNPAARADLIRGLYKKYNTTSGKLLGKLVGAREFTPEELEAWEKELYECTACRRCAQFCPYGIDNSVVLRTGRVILNELKKTPRELMRTMEASGKTGNNDGAVPEAFFASIRFMEEELKDETGIDIRIPVDKENAELLLVPPSADCLSLPESTMGCAKVFHQVGVDWTMSSVCFDSANFGLFTGDDAAMKAKNKQMVDEAKKLGVKKLVIGECGHAYRIMKRMAGGWYGEGLPFEITSILEETARYLREGKIEVDPNKNPEVVTYHDPCNFSRSVGITDEPREILQAVCQDFREMTPNRSDNWCCGGGGGLAVMESIKDFRMNVTGKQKIDQIRATNAKYVAAPCANCKRQIKELVEYHQMDVQVGGIHDLVGNAISITKG